MTERTDRQEGGVYQADDVHDGREVSPFEDYIDHHRDRPYAEFNCPTCAYSIALDEVMQEGGGECKGCGRRLQLHITSHDRYGEFRNVPKDQKEAFR